MKPSSPISLLLFIHLTSAAPIPSISSECQLSSSCQHNLLDNPTLGNRPRRFLDPYFLRPQLSSEVATPRLKELVDEPLASPAENPSSKLSSFSPSQPGEQLVQPATQDLAQKPLRSSSGENVPSTTSLEVPVDPVKDWQKSLLTDEPSEENKQTSRPGVVFSLSEQVKRLYPWIGSREYSDLLVVGIVVLFLLALIAWEAVGRSNCLCGTPRFH
jgi:hypothetical protein